MMQMEQLQQEAQATQARRAAGVTAPGEGRPKGFPYTPATHQAPPPQQQAANPAYTQQLLMQRKLQEEKRLKEMVRREELKKTELGRIQLGLFPVSEEAIWDYCQHMSDIGANKQPLQVSPAPPRPYIVIMSI